MLFWPLWFGAEDVEYHKGEQMTYTYTREVAFTSLSIDGWFKFHPGAPETYQKKTFNSYYEGQQMEVGVLPWTHVFVMKDEATGDELIAHV